MKKITYRNLISLVMILGIMVASAFGAGVASGSTTGTSGTSGVSGGPLTKEQMIAKIDAKYNQNPWLGTPTSNYNIIVARYSTTVTCVFRYYTNGVIGIGYTEKNAYIIKGIIQSKWSGPFGDGWPTSEEMRTADNAGICQRFAGADIYYTPSTGVHTVNGPFLTKWAELGKEKGILGYPTSDRMYDSTLREEYVKFQNGTIAWTYNGTVYLRDLK